MALSSRGLNMKAMAEHQFLAPRRWKEREISPERNPIWTEPKPKSASGERRVAVVYYLCRNGHLDHPHFMEVPLSCSDGLYLKDVINRLDALRGKGMASLYSWSSKRSYKNGFVWHDLSENDFIFPAHGQEYVLKGSEILDPSLIPNPRSLLATASFRSLRPHESLVGENDSDFSAVSRRRNQSWSSIDLSEYKVYKNESSSESNRRLAADASTQTDDRRRRRKPVKDDEIEGPEGEKTPDSYGNQTTELSRDEISPPPSDSSPETLETLMKADGRLVLRQSDGEEDAANGTADSFPSGRTKASTVLMQLISCGSMSFRHCGPSLVRDQGPSLSGPFKGTVSREAGNRNQAKKEEDGTEKEIRKFSGVNLEDKEYFSGSLIETKKKEILPALQRSSSYNADRRPQMELREESDEGVRAKCIPRKLKAATSRQESGKSNGEACIKNGTAATPGGSKRHEV